MKVSIHGTEIVCTDHKDNIINAEIKDRAGNTVDLFFDSIDDLALLADELKFLVEAIEEEEQEQANGTL